MTTSRMVAFAVAMAACSAPHSSPQTPDAGGTADAPASEPDAGSSGPGSLHLGAPKTFPAGGTASSYLTAADLNGDGALDLVDSSPDDADGQDNILILLGDGHGA